MDIKGFSWFEGQESEAEVDLFILFITVAEFSFFIRDTWIISRICRDLRRKNLRLRGVCVCVCACIYIYMHIHFEHIYTC